MRLFTAVDREKAQEAKRWALPKRVYGDAIKRFCLDCSAVNAAITDCGGDDLGEGEPCRLYHVNTVFKRRKATKTALRKAIRAECKFCTGSERMLGCTSPYCALYPCGAGRRPSVAVENQSGLGIDSKDRA